MSLNRWNFASFVEIVASRFCAFSHAFFFFFFLFLFFSRRNTSRFCHDRHDALFVCLPSGLSRDRELYPTVESAPSMSSLLFAQLPFRLPNDCSNIRLSSFRIRNRKKFITSFILFLFFVSFMMSYFSYFFYFCTF